MLHYILQVVAFQLIFLIFFDLFLRKETFFNINRAYLVLTGILAVCMPFIKFKQIKAIVPDDFVIHLPQVIIGNVSQSTSLSSSIIEMAGISSETPSIPIWKIILITGMIVAALMFCAKVYTLIRLVYKNPKRWKSNILIIKLLNSASAFSFFHYVFLGDKLSPENRESILLHEMVHVNQKHSVDLLLFEIFRIVFWFNPLVYIYQNRIAELHEFIADDKAVKYQNKCQFYNQLLLQVFDTKQVSFVNPFFKQSLIKKRISMLSKAKSKQICMLKYALLVPMVCVMLIYTSSYAQESVQTLSETIQVEDSDMSHDDLLKKYLDIILEMKANGATFKEINDYVMPDTNKYLNTKTEYYKFTAYIHYIMDASKKRTHENDGISEAQSKLSESMASKMNRTYDEYVAWKQTDDAKAIWENNSRDGVLRLIVEDAGNMTESEKQKMNHKLDMIERDAYFKKLLIVSMDGRTKVILEDPQSVTKSEPLEVIEVEQDIEVPFAVVEEVPIMLSCQDLQTNLERKTCLSQNVAKHVNKHFNTGIAKTLGLQGKQRISVIFKINKKGNVVEAKARAPHPELEKEAIRVIELLPQFKPGLHKGKPVTVPYSLPILFQVNGNGEVNETPEDSKQNLFDKVRETVLERGEVPFAIVDEIPVFVSCQSYKTEAELKSCTNTQIASVINKNFNVKLASKLGLTGNQRISVAFKIDKDGSIFDVKARAPHPELEAEAIRVVKLLPKFIPGKHKGEVTVVPYSLPILFNVAAKDEKN